MEGVKVYETVPETVLVTVGLPVRSKLGVEVTVGAQGIGVRVFVGCMGHRGGVPVRVFVGVTVKVEVLGGVVVPVGKNDRVTGWPETDPESDSDSELQWTDPGIPPVLREAW